jgi:glycosyltransferase involved in cell wall biosynthesis
MGRELVRQGLSVSLLASDLSLSSRSYSHRQSAWSLRSIEESHDGVHFVWLPAGAYEENNWKRGLSALIFSVAVFLRLITVRSASSATFIGSSPHVFGAFAACVAAAVRRVPFVFEVRDLWPESYEEVTGIRSGALVRIMRSMVDIMYRRAAAIVVLAPANVSAISERGVDKEKIRCIPNGVDLAAFSEVGRERVGDTVRFVYAGAHGPANGLQVVVDACRELSRRGVRGWEVTLIGDGPTKASLVETAGDGQIDGLTFRDAVPKDEIPAVLARFDAGLMILAPAQLFEAGVSPNKLYDYLAANLPVVNNVPGLVANIVSEAGAGINCAPGNPSALADAMTEMATRIRTDPTTHRTGRTYVGEHFDRRKLASDLVEVLGQV